MTVTWPLREEAKALGCTCDWHGSGSIVRFDPECPIRSHHREPYTYSDEQRERLRASSDGSIFRAGMTLKPTMSEAQLQAAIVDCALLLGYLVYHTHDSRRSQPGFPDLVLVRGSRMFFAELKSAKGKLSPAQEEWKAALERAGRTVYVWRPDCWLNGAVEEVLRAGQTAA